MELAIGIIDLIGFLGIFASWLVFLRRAGLNAFPGVSWREFLLPNISFFLLLFVKSLVWVIVLVVWLVQSCPASPWKAVIELDGREVRRVLRVNPAEVSKQDSRQ